MITIHIIIHNEEQGRQISEWLLREKLAFQSVDIDHQDSFTLHENQLIRTGTWKLQARTKALLFALIERELKVKFALPSAPFIYSTPIVNMDPDMARLLMNETQKA